MLESNIFRRSLLVLVLATIVAPAIGSAQGILPRAGRSFSFGILEGPDNLLGDSAQVDTKLTLTVVSQYEGCGVVQSPSGFIENFTFSPGVATVVNLPYDLLQFHDLGKTNKGLLVKTTEPVDLFLHDYVAYAGDGTQLLPDESLDTSYVTFGWGIWNDPFGNEHNNCEFLVTAAHDNTDVTIKPSVNTMLGQQAGVAFTITLNAGETYIVKADTSDHPADPSLSGSTIVSTKPVSVISGLTCAYVPLEVESCNEMMDELIGKKWWGTHFFAPPLGATDTMVEVVLTSDQPFGAIVNNGFVGSVANRVRALASGSAEIKIFSLTNGAIPKVEAHQVAQGNQVAIKGFLGGVSDPTLVTLLDTSLYADTLMWNTPAFGGFQNWAPLVFPTAALASIQVDGQPLAAVGVPTVIHNSSYSTVTLPMAPGVHKVMSPVPIFGLVTGFDLADAYSYMAGGVAPPAIHSTAKHDLLLSADSATTCSTFGVDVALSTPITTSEGIFSLSVPVTYDPSVLHLVGIEPHGVLNTSRYYVDSSVAGTVTVTVLGEPYVTGSDLFRVDFEGWHSVTSTTVGKNATPTACGDAIEDITVLPVTFAVHAPADIPRTFTLSSSPAAVCNPARISITADQIITDQDGLILSRIEVQFDTASQRFLRSQPGSMVLPTNFFESGQFAGRYTLTEPSAAQVSGGDTLLTLQLSPSSVSSSVTIHATIYYLRCGDTLKKDLILSYPISYQYDSTRTKLSISSSSVSLGNQASATVTLAGLPIGSNVKQFSLYVTYDHDLMTYDRVGLANTLTASWAQPGVKYGKDTDTLQFSSIAPLGLNGTLVYLIFSTYVTTASSTPIMLASSLTGQEANCPTIFSSPIASTVFLGKGLCGDTLLRSVMRSETFTLDVAELTPDGKLLLTFHSPTAQTVTIAVYDALGRLIWQGEVSCQPGTNTRQIDVPVHLSSGSFVVRAEATGRIASKQVILVK